VVEQNKKRPSTGETAGEEVVREESATFAEPASVQLPDERARKFRTTGFSRMRTDWGGEDRVMMNRVKLLVQKAYDSMFADAELMLYDLLNTVRDPIRDEHGELQPGPDGLPMWRRNASGSFVEDWSKLTMRERERFLFQFTTNLHLWEQRAADVWGEAMFAKALWEDAFAIGYESLEDKRATIDDRTARARLESREEKYFALYVSILSRKADALVRTMTLLSQRIKDVHTNGA
jgi:hypothetical protein